jgi:hypothetical protein
MEMVVIEREWTAEWILEAWGLRAFGALTTPWKLSTGGRAVSDDESQAAWYVEHTDGFDRAKEVLVWKYQRCRELVDFPIRGPGETLVRALLRRSWGGMLGRPPYQVAAAIHDEFVRGLSSRLLIEPFRPIRADEPEDPLEIAEAANAKYAVGSRPVAYVCEG